VDALDGQPGDPPGGERRLPLAVVEVRRAGDDGAGDRPAEERFGVGPERSEDEAGEFLGGERPAAEGGPVVGAHVPLEQRGAALRSR
jgi:hypothetical protein